MSELREIRDFSEKSTQSIEQERSALKLFTKYLHQEKLITLPNGVRIQDIDPMHYNMYLDQGAIVEPLFGRFGSFVQNEGKKYNTFSNYISQIKCRIQKDYPNLELFKQNNGMWYKSMLRRVKKSFEEDCAEEGTSLESPPPPCTLTDLSLMSSILFRLNSTEFYLKRLFAIMQFQFLGRVEEICAINWNCVRYCDRANTIQFLLRRPKNTGLHNYYIMINAKLNWKICPLHALASYVASNINAVADPSNNRVFYSINKGNCSKVVCDLLAFIEQKVKDMMNHGELPQDTVYTSNMKSHSFRHGGSTFMQESPFIQRHHIECRGGWKTIGSNNKSGHYLHHTEVVDGFGARALSQWKQSNGGGTLPTVSDLLSDQDRETFHQYCMNIFGVATNVLDLKVIEALAIVLVIYFPEVQQEHNDDQNVLLTRIMLRANQEIPESKLHEWSTTFRNAFRASNAAYLPFNELNPVEKVAISTVQDIMQTMVEGNQASSISAERLVVLTERVVNIEATMQRNHVETMNMLKQIGSIASIPPPLVGVVSSAAGSLSVSPSTVSEPTITTVLMSNTAKACNSDKYLSDYNNSWSNMTMEKAFYNYFDQQLSKCTLPVSKPRRRFLQEFRKVVEFMKLFNTQPINIGKRPSDSLKDTQSLNNWRVALNNLAYHLSNNATEFLPATTTSEDDTTNISATSTHIAKKQKKQSHSVSAMLKIIGNIEKTKCRTLPVPVYVIEDSLLVQ